jgi:hypothetical protein
MTEPFSHLGITNTKSMTEPFGHDVVMGKVQDPPVPKRRDLGIRS